MQVRRSIKQQLPEARGSNYLQIKLQGKLPNLQAIGGQGLCYGRIPFSNFTEHYLSRGYQSSVSRKISILDWEIPTRIDFPAGGLGRMEKAVGSGIFQLTKPWKYIKTVQAKAGGWHKNRMPRKPRKSRVPDLPLFYPMKKNTMLISTFSPCCRHQHSQLGPGAAVGDLNGDGREDLFFSGAHGQAGAIIYPKSRWYFLRSNPFQKRMPFYEDMGALFF